MSLWHQVVPSGGVTRNADRNAAGVTRNARNVTDVTAPTPAVLEALCARVDALERQVDTLTKLVGKAAVDVAPMKSAPSSSNAERQRRFRERRKGKA